MAHENSKFKNPSQRTRRTHPGARSIVKGGPPAFLDVVNGGPPACPLPPIFSAVPAFALPSRLSRAPGRRSKRASRPVCPAVPVRAPTLPASHPRRQWKSKEAYQAPPPWARSQSPWNSRSRWWPCIELLLHRLAAGPGQHGVAVALV